MNISVTLLVHLAQNVLCTKGRYQVGLKLLSFLAWSNLPRIGQRIVNPNSERRFAFVIFSFCKQTSIDDLK